MDSLLLLAPLLGAAWCTVIQMRVRRLERRIEDVVTLALRSGRREREGVA
jgi:hypothetical protein